MLEAAQLKTETASVATSQIPVSAFSSILALPAGFRNPSVGPGGVLIPGATFTDLSKARVKFPEIARVAMPTPPFVPGVHGFPTLTVLAGVPSTKETLEARTNKATVGVAVGVGALILLILAGAFS